MWDWVTFLIILYLIIATPLNVYCSEEQDRFWGKDDNFKLEYFITSILKASGCPRQG
jgi:hypothetical protein